MSPVNSARDTQGERAASDRVELVSAHRPTSARSSAESTTTARSARRAGEDVGTATTARTSPRRHMSIDACGVPGVPRSHAATPEPPGPSTRTRPTRPDDEQLASALDHAASAGAPWPAEYAEMLTSTWSLPTVKARAPASEASRPPGRPHSSSNGVAAVQVADPAGDQVGAGAVERTVVMATCAGEVTSAARSTGGAVVGAGGGGAWSRGSRLTPEAVMAPTVSAARVTPATATTPPAATERPVRPGCASVAGTTEAARGAARRGGGDAA